MPIKVANLNYSFHKLKTWMWLGISVLPIYSFSRTTTCWLKSSARQSDTVWTTWSRTVCSSRGTATTTPTLSRRPQLTTVTKTQMSNVVECLTNKCFLIQATASPSTPCSTTRMSTLAPAEAPWLGHSLAWRWCSMWSRVNTWPVDKLKLWVNYFTFYINE